MSKQYFHVAVVVLSSMSGIVGLRDTMWLYNTVHDSLDRNTGPLSYALTHAQDSRSAHHALFECYVYKLTIGHHTPSFSFFPLHPRPSRGPYPVLLFLSHPSSSPPPPLRWRQRRQRFPSFVSKPTPSLCRSRTRLRPLTAR